jgi:nucleoside 2-deoxyribosyltransferase
VSDPRIYLAGPDIYHPQALDIMERKKNVCARYGLEGVVATDFLAGIQFSGVPAAAPRLYRERAKVIKECDGLIANMTPFRGTSIDPTTALEMGMMEGLGRPVVGYTLDPTNYADRIRRLHEEIEEPVVQAGARLVSPDGITIEDFGLADTVMIAGAALSSGAPISSDFESAVRWTRRLLNA